MSELLSPNPGQTSPDSQSTREKLSRAVESEFVCGGKCRICPFPGVRCGQMPHDKEA